MSARLTRRVYRTKDGRALYKPILSMNGGMPEGAWCLVCGERRDREADAERGYCETCEESLIFGIEQLMLKGIAEVGA